MHLGFGAPPMLVMLAVRTAFFFPYLVSTFPDWVVLCVVHEPLPFPADIEMIEAAEGFRAVAYRRPALDHTVRNDKWF